MTQAEFAAAWAEFDALCAEWERERVIVARAWEAYAEFLEARAWEGEVES